MVILDAIEAANSTDSKAIRDKIAETKDFVGATGISLLMKMAMRLNLQLLIR